MADNLENPKFDDTIQCSIFSITPTNLQELCQSVNKTITALSKDYIWHRDELKICVSIFDEKEDFPVHLTSTTCFGDNIEDEWFIVYLILQITLQYPDLIVQIEDNDGDFLLIEAADLLPSWANPDTTKNRVFIYQNKLHIIPPEVVGLNSKLELLDAIQLVAQKSVKTKANNEIQEVILKRIGCYPEKIKESRHRALITLPVDIATLLTIKPSLISPIVTAFCNHDIWDAKCFKDVKLEHCVTTPILFTKYLYAMLTHSHLPKVSKLSNHSQNIKNLALGWKLACGYEIITSKLCNDVFDSSEYHNFIKRLTKNGYFKDNIEGSKNYNEHLEKAKEYFSNIECPMSSHNCYNISVIKVSEEFESVKNLLLNGNNTNKVDIDSDEWLNINPDELNTFLNTHYGKKVVHSDSSNTSRITTQLAHFLKKTSDFEGIEYVSEEESDTNQIDFDSDQFICSIEKMLSLVSGENNSPEDFENDFSEEDDEDDDAIVIEDNLKNELESKLIKSDMNNSKNEYIIKNLLQSIKEEGISGPSSNVLKNIDVSNIEILDSDDD